VGSVICDWGIIPLWCGEILIEKADRILDELLIALAIKCVRHTFIIQAFNIPADRS
jgi:hypothetical protein